MARKEIGTKWDRENRNNMNDNFKELYNDTGSTDAFEAADEANAQASYAQESGDYANDEGDYASNQGDYAKAQGEYATNQGDYAKTQGDYAKDAGNSVVTNWLSPVDTFDDIATTYPEPSMGDTVQELEEGKVYRFNGSDWEYTQGYSATAIADLQSKIGNNEDQLEQLTLTFDDKFPNNAGSHNSIYRGKHLGNEVTTEQYASIQAGTFEDMYIGDYWTIGGVNYRIAAFDYYVDTGDNATTQHHVTLVPDEQLYTHEMNDTNTTDGGYIGSLMYTEGLSQAKTTIEAAFPNHVLNHRKYLSNAVTDGAASGASWYDSDVELMNEHMVYGSNATARADDSSNAHRYNVGIEKSQLPLFRFRHDLICIRNTFWLRDISSASYFAHVGTNGGASRNGASNSLGVRPAFSII